MAPYIEALIRMKRAFLFRGACLLLAFVVTVGAFSAPARASTPEDFIQSLSDHAVAINTDPSLDQRARYDAFRVLILGSTDLDQIASFALGRYAGAMHVANRYDEYLSLYREYVVRIYATQLGQYSGEKLVISRSMPHGTNEVIVFSEIEPGASGGSPLAVNWRLRNTEGGYKIVDVQIAGAWMSIEQQDQFTSIIANNNRQMTKLIEFLRQQLASSSPTGSASEPQSQPSRVVTPG